MLNNNPHGMIESRPSHITAALAALIPTGGPVLLEGSPGTGKSALLAEAAALTQRTFYSPRVSQYDPTDLAGIPWPDAEAGTIRWLHDNQEIPWCHCKGACSCPPSILCLDELGQAPTSVQNVTLQLLHSKERRLRSLRLPPPDRCFVAAATNRTTDRAGSGQLTTAVRSRFLTSFLVVPHLADLRAVAARDGWHHTVRSWLKVAPKFLNDFDPARPGPFSCPRSIEQLSRLAAAPLPEETRLAAYAGAVGVPAASSYITHAEIAGQVPDADSILGDPSGATVPTEAPLLWAVSAVLSAAMRGVKAEETIAALLTYLDRLPGEYAALTVIDAMRAGCPITKTRSGLAWTGRNSKLILAAREEG